MMKALFLVFAGLLWLASGRCAQAYVLEGQKWANGNIVMNLQLNNVDYALPSGGLADGSASWDAVAQAALAEWDQYLLNVQFTNNSNVLTPTNTDGKNSVFFSSNVFGTTFPSGVLGITARRFTGSSVMLESDTVINIAFQWNSYRGDLRPNAQQNAYIFDLRRVLDHELGHALGLNHPDLASPAQTVTAVMNSVTSNLDHIELDDISGVWSMYGQKSPAVPVIVVASPAAGGTITGGGNLGINTTPTLTAVPALGYAFQSWEDGSTNATRTITVAIGGGTYTATFVQALDNWQSIGVTSPGSVTSVLFAKGKFYGFGGSGTITSPDGVTWTVTPSAAPLSSLAERVVYGNGLFVAGDYSGNIYTSTDGITWATNTSVGVNLAGLGFGNGMFVAGGYTQNTTPTPILTSTDAVHWTSHTSGLQGCSLGAVTYANGTFVVIGGDNTTFSSLTSADGNTWTVTTLASGFGPSTVAYGEGLFVASCGYGATFYSRDAKNWLNGQAIGTGSNNDAVTDIAYGNGTFIALSNGISSSPDGINWTARVFNGGLSVGRIAFDLNTFILQTSGNLYRATVPAPSGGQPVLPVLSSASTRQAVVNTALTYQMAASNAPLAFNATGLPAGLSVNVQTGAITGTPSVTGTFPITLFATNDAGSGTATLTLTVANGATPQLFSDWVTANHVTGGMAGTPYGDGVPNLLKYVYNIDPTIPLNATARAALPVLATASSGTVLTLTFPENKALANVGVTVQSSFDLGTWSTTSGSTIASTGATNGNGDPVMVATVPVTAANQFIRLLVTPQ